MSEEIATLTQKIKELEARVSPVINIEAKEREKRGKRLVQPFKPMREMDRLEIAGFKLQEYASNYNRAVAFHEDEFAAEYLRLVEKRGKEFIDLYEKADKIKDVFISDEAKALCAELKDKAGKLNATEFIAKYPFDLENYELKKDKKRK